jgi:hypothetical protein
MVVTLILKRSGKDLKIFQVSFTGLNIEFLRSLILE